METMVRQVSDVLPQVPDHAIQEDLSNYRGQVLLVTVECRQASVHMVLRIHVVHKT